MRAATGPGATMRRRAKVRGSLVTKYGLVFGVAIVGTLVISGFIDLNYSYREQTAAINRLQDEQTRSAASTIRGFVNDTTKQIEWANLPPGLPPETELQLRQAGYDRLQKQTRNTVTEVQYLDGNGREQLFMSSRRPRVVGSGKDFSTSSEFLNARTDVTYHGPVVFQDESEPYMKIAVAEERAGGGVTVADVNLKQIRDSIERVSADSNSTAYVVDSSGHLIAHPDIALVLRKSDWAGVPQVRDALQGKAQPIPGPIELLPPFRSRDVVTTFRGVDTNQRPSEQLGWLVFIEQPLDLAYAPLYESLGRIPFVLAWGLGLAVIVSLALAHRLVTPIRTLQEGASHIASGAMDQRVDVRTGDELQALADEFNYMAERVEQSRAGLEREVAERTQELRTTLTELEEKRRQLEAANQHKNTFLAYMSHDLRTPLNSIIGFSDVLSRQMYGPLNETQLEYLNDILTAARHQFRLIKGLLELARYDVGQSILEPSVFSFADMLRNSVTMMGAEAKERQIDLGLQVDPGVDLIEADEGKLQEIVLNLLSNAVKYTPDGGRVALRARRVDDEIDVAVSDTGIGIAPEDHENVFREFWRVKQPDARGQGGAGLGLALAQRFVTLHGGRIWVESQLGLGSTFRFTLPAGKPEVTGDSTARGPKSAAEGSPEQSAVDPPRVLVVDDDAQAVRLVESALRPEGYDVVGAANGMEGLQLMRSQRPGLVILDLSMPGMDGFTVLDRVREDSELRDLPVIVFTGETVDANGRARLDGRISQIVVKGDVTQTRLMNLVRTYYQAHST